MNKETSLFQEKPTEFSFLKHSANLGEPDSQTKWGDRQREGKKRRWTGRERERGDGERD